MTQNTHSETLQEETSSATPHKFEQRTKLLPAPLNDTSSPKSTSPNASKKSIQLENTVYSFDTQSFDCDSYNNERFEISMQSTCYFILWNDGVHSGKLLTRYISSTKPNAKTIVFINGGPGLDHLQMMNPTLLQLRDNYNLIWYDQRGTGASYLPIKDLLNSDVIGLRQYINDLIAIKRLLTEESVHLYAHSFGGLISITAARIYPNDFSNLILSSPTYGVLSYSKGIASENHTMMSFEKAISAITQLSPQDKKLLKEKFYTYLRTSKSISINTIDYNNFPTVGMRWVEEEIPAGAIADTIMFGLIALSPLSNFVEISTLIDRSFTDPQFLKGRIKTLRQHGINGFLNHSMICNFSGSFPPTSLSEDQLKDFLLYCRTILVKNEMNNYLSSITLVNFAHPTMVFTGHQDFLKTDAVLLKKEHPSAFFLEMQGCDHEMLATEKQCIPLGQIREFLK